MAAPVAASLPLPGAENPGDDGLVVSVTARLKGAGWYARLGTVLLWGLVVGLLYLALRDTPLVAIGLLLSQLGLGQVLILVAANLLILALLTVRWALLLRALGHPLGLARLMGLRLAGFGVSYFTPGPQFGGEPVQVDLLRRRGVPLTAAISSVFLDRLVDLLANFTFLVLGLVTIIVSGVLAGKTASPAAWLVLPGLLVLPLAHLVALWFGRQPLTWFLGWLVGRVPWPWLARAQGVVRQSEAQISALCRTQPAVLVQVVLLSGLIWLLVVLEFTLTLYFLGIGPNLVRAVSALTAARLAFLMPLPGGLGVLEASQVYIAQALGWGASVGIALSLIIRARDVLLAALGMWLGGLAYRNVLVQEWGSEKRS